MFNLQNNIIDICNNNYKYLLNLQNVTSIGLGFKYINSINTLEPCIHVLVEKKLPNKYISNNNLIPKQYMGLKTDVIKIGKPKFTSNDAIPQKFRPLEGGCALGIAIRFGTGGLMFGRGTLGCIVTKTDEENGSKSFFILSNNHVLARLNSLPIGTSIIQPNIENGGTTRDVVAYLSDFIQLKFVTNDTNPDMRPINYVDCAIAEISNLSLTSSIINQVGKLSGYSEAILNEPVKKVGYVSGLTSGNVLTTNATLEVKVDANRSNIFLNQILASLPVETGDSGSIALNGSNEAIGLIFSGTDEGFSYMNDIGIVLNYLNVELYTD